MALPTTVTITGSGFVAGAVVTGAVAGVDTFGTAVVSNSANPADKCTGFTATPGAWTPATPSRFR